MFFLSRDQPVRTQGRCNEDALWLMTTPEMMKINDGTVCSMVARVCKSLGFCVFLYLLFSDSNSAKSEQERETMCSLCGTVVSVVAFKVKGRGFKSTHGCSHTVQKPSINPGYLANARKI